MKSNSSRGSEQGLERYLRYQAPHIKLPISDPPFQYETADLPYQAPTYDIKPLVLDVQHEPPTYDIKLFELNCQYRKY